MAMQYARFRIPAIIATTAVIAAGSLASGEEWLERQQVVVELYTSQGCSSCPPADELITHLVDCERIVPLGFHVDYWDYLGWQDKFADKVYTQRQVSYANVFDERMIYTPQIIVQGKEYMVGSYADEVRKAVVNAAGTLDSQRIVMDFESMQISGSELDGELAITLVSFDPEVHRVDIGAGENRGRKIAYANVVTGIREIALDTINDGRARVPGAVPVLLGDAKHSVSVLLHDRDSRQIMAAWVKHSDTGNRRACLDELRTK